MATTGVPKLDADQEVALAQLIDRGMRAQAVLSETVSRDPELEAMAATGLQAFGYMVVGSLPLVISIAAKYVGHGLELADLVQEGNLGLIKAVNVFDYKRGLRFSTCAYPYIKGAITRALGRVPEETLSLDEEDENGMTLGEKIGHYGD